MDTSTTQAPPTLNPETHPPGRIQFGDRILAARKALGLTQTELADKVAASTQTIRSWENGRTAITEPLMARLAAALNTTPGDLWPEWSAEQVRRGGPRIPARSQR